MGKAIPIRLSPFLIMLTLLFTLIIPSPISTHASSFLTKISTDGRVYKLYVPSSYTPGEPLPLVIMLHGCTQSPDDFARGTKMNQYAETYHFLVAYPEQPTSSNANKCWNWFDSQHQSRGKGEPASIAGVVHHIRSQYSIDTTRIYAAGLSAGGAMSVILGVTYPDLFAAIGVGSGLEYKAATSIWTANMAMLYGGPNPNQQGTLAYQAMGSFKRVVPTIVFHGTNDYVVYPINGNQVISMWAQTNDLAADGVDNDLMDDQPELVENKNVPGGRTYTKSTYQDQTGKVILEKYIVNQMGHAWSGGDSSGTYTDPSGPDASLIMWNFFQSHPKD
ncbi:extracellular catalytic domain type 1 short-chain-length polyhydroxyalkanoate depolymerase [Thermoflavimicrobium dichotomicum]|uniref:Esterase, PHB depolymerase family n=1 Tax=Thermoflavimicrobium dichotomicum TaxID=46223 RepID=A0A1I3NNU3_9BACL|nr:PHB depolymerase family esterase [Thermoflavimicrobium dichotomicum]SFJ10935.1 esterase, PHB depolymerase family [Thermoflavimicrobium dichotomicum]